MERNFCLVGLLFVFSFLVAPISASAYPIKDFKLGETSIGELGNAGDKAVAAWVQGLLSKCYNDPLLSAISKVEFGEDNKGLVVYDPSFDWLYAVVKYGRNFIVFTDNNDGLLTTGLLSHVVSNVTFLAKAQAPAPDSEPTTMLLLSTGLIGLVALRRRFKKR